MVDLADELYFDLEDIEKLEPPMVFSEVAPSIVFPEFNGTLFDSAEYPVQIGSRDTSKRTMRDSIEKSVHIAESLNSQQ